MSTYQCRLVYACIISRNINTIFGFIADRPRELKAHIYFYNRIACKFFWKMAESSLCGHSGGKERGTFFGTR